MKKGNANWTESGYVRTETDYLEEEVDVSNMNFSWFTVKSNQSETPEELEERKKAIAYQIQNGIIQPNGMPVGMGRNNKPPVQPNNQKKVDVSKMSKFARKALKKTKKEFEHKQKLQRKIR